MSKLDLKKEFKHLYNPSAKEVSLVDVPEMSFIMADGAGDPNNSAEFEEVIGFLYSISFTLKFIFKKGRPPVDYAVMPLEGLWWMKGTSRFDMNNRDDWRWTLMIAQPDFITKNHVGQAVSEVAKKKGSAALSKVRFERFYEGLSAQIMHVGPYSAEGPTIERIDRFVKENGYRSIGKHHEIYLGDPRRCAPEKLKTVLRHQVEKNPE